MISIDLSGKVAVITGGGQGLGLATATALHQAGAKVILNYFEDPAGLNQKRASEAAAKLGERAVAMAADVRDRAAVTSLFDEIVRRFRRLDIVVNNAGIIRDKTIQNLTDEEWNAVIETNLTAVYCVSQVAAARMGEGGRIVNMASISGVTGPFGQANYAAAKAGVIAFTKVASKEFAKRKINVNAVAPGVVLTEMGKSIPEKSQAVMKSQIPLARFGEASEIANVVLFLCSDLASYMTGQTLHVNGGWWG